MPDAPGSKTTAASIAWGEGETLTFSFRALSAWQLDILVRSHRPTSEDGKDAIWGQSFRPALISAASAEPIISAELADLIVRTWAVGESHALFEAALAANWTRSTPVPPSWRNQGSLVLQVFANRIGKPRSILLGRVWPNPLDPFEPEWLPDDLAAAMQVEHGPGIEDRAWQPCPACGVPDAVMRDPATNLPRRPSPLVAVGLECLSCQDLAEKSTELAETLGGENKQLPPWIRVVLEPAPKDG